MPVTSASLSSGFLSTAQCMRVGVEMRGNTQLSVWTAFCLWVCPWSWPKAASSQWTQMILLWLSPSLGSTWEAVGLSWAPTCPVQWHETRKTAATLPVSLRQIHSRILISTLTHREADLKIIHWRATWRTVLSHGKRDWLNQCED